MKQEDLLRAVGEIDEELIWNAKKERKHHRRPLVVALVAAAAVILCLSTAWAGVIVYRAGFVKAEDGFHSEQRTPYGYISSNYYTEEMPKHTADEMAEISAKHGQEFMEMSGQHTEENGGYVRRDKSGELVDTGAGYAWDLIFDANILPSMSAVGQYQDYYHPDVSYMESTLIPVEGSFVYFTENGSGSVWGPPEDGKQSETKPEQLYRASVWGAYRTASNGTFVLMLDYQPAMPFGPAWFIGDNITLRDTVKSAGGTEFDLVQADNWLIAHATYLHGQIIIYGIDCTVDEVVEQITHLDLGDVPTVFNTGNE